MDRFKEGDEVIVCDGGIYPKGSRVKILMVHGIENTCNNGKQRYYRVGLSQVDFKGGLYDYQLEPVGSKYCSDSRKFEVGDEVKIISESESFLEGRLGQVAKIIKSQKYEYPWVIEWSDGETCGVKEENIIKYKNIMSKIKDFVVRSMLSKEEKLLRDNGLKNDCGQYTDEARDLVINKLVKDNENYLIEIATAIAEEENKNK